jgi:transposase
MAQHSLLKVIGEVGTDLTQWPTQKHFTAWTGLSPGSAQSGKRRKNQPRQRNRTGRLFCDMARGVTRSSSALGASYRRLQARRDGAVAIKATARKLAATFWRIMVPWSGLRRARSACLRSQSHSE